MTTMTKADVLKVMERFPLLTTNGMGPPSGYWHVPPAERQAAFDRDRRALAGSLAACNRVLRWLAAVPRRKGVRMSSSYWLKHEAEERVGYVPNGVFVLAAVHAGFRFRVVEDSPNVMFAITPKDARRASERFAATV